MKKILVLLAVLVLAMPMAASAIVGKCVTCHTMHGTQQGSLVDDQLNFNLLRYDCLGCHAQDPTAGTKEWVLEGNSIPQVAHGSTDVLAGGKFNYNSARKVHSVVDVTEEGLSATVPLDENLRDQPPGLPHSSNRHVFTSEDATDAFDMFTCAGARGCHGTRSQVVWAATVDNGTANNWEVTSRRTGMAAISGAHHADQVSGEMTSDGYGNTTGVHNGAIVGAGYRFIPGLKGFENAAREYVSGTDHNEYYGVPNGFTSVDTGCDACHAQDIAQSNTRAGFESNINIPNHSMSGFCSSCHGNFHSAGQAGPDGDYVFNGTSGAFLRHPSDYIIPTWGEYGEYQTYDPTAPVARPTVEAAARGDVDPGQDMVMCLTCHVAHGSDQNYLLRFDYALQVSNGFGGQDTARAAGGCMACHSYKGSTVAVDPSP